MKMTRKQFFAVLRKSRIRNWRVRRNGQIRDRYGCCPIVGVARHTGVATRQCHPVAAWWAGGTGGLGLTNGVIGAIVDASDHRDATETRRDLLRACGIQRGRP